MNLDLSQKKALVCGSTAGIGLAVAQSLAQLNCQVTLVARNEEKLKLALGQLDGNGHDYLVADFSKPEELKTKILAHTSARNTYHILINNTGGPPGGPAAEAKEEEFMDAFQMHLMCNHILAQALIPGMKAEKYGRIVNIISTSVKQPIAGLGVSNTIRGAVANWSKTLSSELAPFGITVNNVLPGATNTGRLNEIAANRAMRSGKSKEEEFQAFADATPMKRVGEPWEIAAGVAFLASPSAAFISGINLPIDGGRTKSL
ncbi:MAG: SDR family oxidoreductase [Bacteroidota bacterium]